MYAMPAISTSGCACLTSKHTDEYSGLTMGAAITKQELKRMLRDRPTKRDLRATLEDLLKDYPTKRELKRDLGSLLGHYVTKRDLLLAKRDLESRIEKSMRRQAERAIKAQDVRFAKRISESEEWSERVFATNERVDKLGENMIRRFNETDGKVDALEHRLTDKIEDAIETSEHRIVGAMQTIVTQVGAKLTPKEDHRRLEKRVTVLERKAG